MEDQTRLVEELVEALKATFLSVQRDPYPHGMSCGCKTCGMAVDALSHAEEFSAGVAQAAERRFRKPE